MQHLPNQTQEGKSPEIRRIPAFIPLLALAALAPLPFGADNAEGVACLALLLAAALGLHLLEKGRHGMGIGRMALPALCYGGAVLWAFAQIPLHVSAQPSATAEGVLRLLLYGGVFWLSACCARNERFAERALEVVVAAATVYALYGLAAKLAGSERVLWVQKTHYAQEVTATFLSRNVCATYLGMGIFCTCALMMRRLLRGASQLRGRVLLRAVVGNAGRRDFALLLMGMIQVLALALTRSRSGFLAFAAGGFVLLLMFGLMRPRTRGKTLLLLVVTSVCGGAFLYLAAGSIHGGKRWASMQVSLSERREMNAGVKRAIADHRLAGTGLGTFEEAFVPYITPVQAQRALDRHDRLDHAHNTYLQLGMELGIPAAALLIACPMLLALRCFSGVATRRRHGVYPALGVAISVQVGTHAFFDFSMEIPAIAITYALLMGLAWAQAFSSRSSL